MKKNRYNSDKWDIDMLVAVFGLIASIGLMVLINLEVI